jgi:hypothetical protein
LGARAARELAEPAARLAFQRWLDAHQCYVFTLNGFPYGQFHGGRIKEQVFVPDWTMAERLEYTNLLFDLLAELVPPGEEGSVSTVPVSFKEFMGGDSLERQARANLWRCIEHIERLARRSGQRLHLGLEPEPCGFLETTAEAVRFFEQMRADRPGDLRLDEHLGLTYDCCHLAVTFEQPGEALGRLRQQGIKISKIHLSNALKVVPTPEARQALKPFMDEVYLHQVVAQGAEGAQVRFKDLDVALAEAAKHPPAPNTEWRIHFHIPLQSVPAAGLGHTADHLLAVLAEVRAHPQLCSHLELETYTWEVLPASLKSRHVVDQLAAEYEWVLAKLRS